ncbi:MAG: tyrosine-type recombinase/integrase [Marinobacter sp.]
MACETPHPLENKIQMYKRSETANVWQYRFYVTQPNGKPFDHRKSARCSDFKQACIIAFEDFQRVSGKVEQGERVSLTPEITVHDCYRFARTQYLQDIAQGFTRKSTWTTLERYYLREIDPTLGTKPIKSINLETWMTYRAKVIAEKPHLSPRTLDYIKSAMRMCLNAAVDMKAIHEIPVLERQSRGRKRKPNRPLVWFNLRAQKILLDALDKNVTEKYASKRKNEIEHAESLRDYVHLALSTGLRPEELNTLTFNEIEKIERNRQTKAKLAVIHLHSQEGRKTDGRRFTGLDGSGQTIEKILRRRGLSIRDNSNALVFPSDHKKKFSEIIKKHKIQHDKNMNRRSRHALRHSFICNQICEGMNLNEIALKAGTSVKVIENHYARELQDTDIAEYKKTKVLIEREKSKEKEFDADWV